VQNYSFRHALDDEHQTNHSTCCMRFARLGSVNLDCHSILYNFSDVIVGVDCNVSSTLLMKKK
jgi:uncharacterized protein YcgI (DUF1989 family)